MPIVAADLVLIGAANHVEADTGTQGGAQAKEKKIEFTDLAANDQIEILSSSASDTDQKYDIVGKDGAGSDVSENLQANGTTPVVTTATYERFNKIVQTAGSALVGTITVQRDAAAGAITTLENAGASPTGVEITEVRKIYIGLVVPGITDSFYEKMFYLNNHATLTLTSANVQLSDASDPTGTDLKVATETALDDTTTITNRLTLPGGVSFVDNQVNQQVVDGNHTAGAAIGIWIENAVTGGASAIKATFNVQLNGNTI